MTIKRGFDVVASALGILLLTPVWIVVSIAIKKDSKGSVIFKQKRLTKNGRIFTMYKFRTMFENVEHTGTGLFNYENDPRVTKVGRFLRNTSIDELPQLFNVLKGDISIVGPRPAVEYELGDYETLNRKYKKRFKVLGGITGLAQVNGRNENSWEEKVIFDNKYIDEFRKYGVIIDIRILARTILHVCKRSGIYETRIENSKNKIESSRMSEEEIVRIAHLPDR